MQKYLGFVFVTFDMNLCYEIFKTKHSAKYSKLINYEKKFINIKILQTSISVPKSEYPETAVMATLLLKDFSSSTVLNQIHDWIS